MAATSLDRLPPHSIEAEQGALGCCLLDPNEAIPVCIEKLRDAEAFYDLRHQVIYAVLLAMYDAKEPVDLITVQQRLKDKAQLDSVGGIVYLASLPNAVPSAANLEMYADIVHEKRQLREFIRECTGSVQLAYEFEGKVSEFLDAAEQRILAASEQRVVKSEQTMKALIPKAITTIEELHERQGMPTGIPTGFADYDKMTGGLHNGEMIVIAARPSVGKSSIAMNIAEHVAVDLNKPVGVFSLEMTAESLALRTLCSRSRVNLRNVRDGFLAERDFPKLTGAAGKLSKAPLVIDDTSGLSIMQLRAKARRMWKKYSIKLFVIDYLQLLNSTKRKNQTREQEIADISSGIKGLAKELNVPVIVLAQLNREIEKDKTRKPRLSDLRESGAIEQDADVAGLLYKRRLPGEDEDPECDAVPTNLLIAKQRNGPCGDVELVFMKSYTRFESAARVSPDDPTE